MNNPDDDDPWEEVQAGGLNQVTVRVYQSTMGHIISEHPEVYPIGQAPILSAIKDPSAIHVSGTGPKSLVFIDYTTTFGGHPLNVVVRMLSNSSNGRVSTCLFTSDTQNHPTIWKKKSDEPTN